uniref:sugar phosphate isomerase/epimerase family protein n=1 Tax=Pedobacter schmidteae TaxID=2201271 RepID=UPI000EB1725B|nr:sugar phosphate isomerase/epimerase [Pedobacter schmidteae]
MKILFFCTYWGSEHLKWTDFLTRVKKSGYDGVEFSLPHNAVSQANMISAIHDFGLQWIGVHWDTITPNFPQHKKEMTERLLTLSAAKPLFITSHTGKDHFSFRQNIALLSAAQEISNATGISILHETHRGKFSFAAHYTQAFLKELPELLLTLDISHWFSVAESYLEDQNDALELALSRTRHIHSRIGFTQSPQVNDPRNIVWKEALQQHLKHWDKVVAMRIAEKADYFTFTSEFGPFPYMQWSPDGKSNETHQWEINEYMKELLKNRYYVQ